MQNEVKCYALHIPQKYFKKMFSEKVKNIIEKHDGAVIAMSKNPMLYVASFVFKTEKQRNRAYADFGKIGIIPVIEKEPTYVQKDYVPKTWL